MTCSVKEGLLSGMSKIVSLSPMVILVKVNGLRVGFLKSAAIICLLVVGPSIFFASEVVAVLIVSVSEVSISSSLLSEPVESSVDVSIFLFFGELGAFLLKNFNS